MPETSNNQQPPASAPGKVQKGDQGGTLGDAWTTIQSILTKLARALDEFKTIEVQTIVMEMSAGVEKTADSKPVLPVFEPNKGSRKNLQGLVTRIDMLDGDIVYYRSSGLEEPLASKLDAVHAEHVKMGQKIFVDNLALLADIVERFRKSE